MTTAEIFLSRKVKVEKPHSGKRMKFFFNPGEMCYLYDFHNLTLVDISQQNHEVKKKTYLHFSVQHIREGCSYCSLLIK